MTQVVINELYPKADPAAYAFIELYNNGSESVSLNQWKLESASGQSFILNASSVIPSRGYLVFFRSQTGMTLSTEGDTVRLIDEKGSLKDAQSYPGILGYNTAVGRTADGAGVWALCTKSTPNQPNACPVPTPTPVPTFAPLATPTLVFAPTATPTPTPQIKTPLADTQALGATIAVTPTPTPTPGVADFIRLDIPRLTVVQILVIFIAWASIAAFALWRRGRKQ